MKSIDVENVPTFIAIDQISDEACDQVIQAFNILDPHQGMISDGVNENIKKSYDLNIPPNFALKKYQEELIEIKNQYVKYFQVEEHIDKLSIIEHMNIQKYPKGGAFFGTHCDRGVSGANKYRELVFMTYLNDVNHGGETQFFNQNVVIKPKKGLTVFWPAGWTHVHRGLPSSTDEKMIITGWFNYGP